MDFGLKAVAESYGLHPAFGDGAAYFIGLTIVYLATSMFVVARNFPSLKDLKPKDLVGVHTRVLCTIHCLISSLGAASVIVPYWVGAPFFFDVTPTSPAIGAPMLIAWEAAELVFTTILDLQYEPEPLNLLHHAAGLSAEISALYLGTGHMWLIWVHIAQFTQPFLYAGWVLHKLKMTSGILFPLCSGFCLLSWFGLRIVLCGPVVLYSIWQNRSLFATSLQFYILMGSTCVFVTLNTYWFKLLLSKALSILGGSKKSKPKKEA
jgi:hypothetical protein